MHKKLTAVVFGRVQGVGFRLFARSAARRLGLSGYVRNQADGSVYVSAQGDADRLQTFFEDLRRGPGHARVERISTAWEEATPRLGAALFEVRD